MSRNIQDLSLTISNAVNTLTTLLQEDKVPAPSFSPAKDNEPAASKDANEIVDRILDATTELHDLLINPAQLIRTYSSHGNLLSIHFIYRFKIPQLVPLDGTTTFTTLAQQCGQPESTVHRFLRHAMSIRIFQEPDEGVVRHTKASVLLLEDSFYNWIGGQCEEAWPAATKTIEALSRFPGSESAEETGFALTTTSPHTSLYTTLSTSPARNARFSAAMGASSSGPGFSPLHLLSACHTLFTSLPPGSLFIDVGGATGHVAKAVAEQFPRLEYVVQDLRSVVDDGRKKYAEERKKEYEGLKEGEEQKERAEIAFEAHDFLTPQPTRESEVGMLYLRWVLHNHPDSVGVVILRNLIPALVPGRTRVLVQDYVLEDYEGMQGLPMYRRRLATTMDLTMQQMFNTRERTETDWKKLVAQADSRFEWVCVHRPPGSALGIIEIAWSGDQEKDA